MNNSSDTRHQVSDVSISVGQAGGASDVTPIMEAYDLLVEENGKITTTAVFKPLHGRNGYVPITLQYSPYTATTAREQSIAAHPEFDVIENRSYKDKTYTSNPNIDRLTNLENISEQVSDDTEIVFTCRPPRQWYGLK